MKRILYIIMVLWFCVCDIQAQAITLQQLKNTSWHLSNSKKITWYKNAKQICT